MEMGMETATMHKEVVMDCSKAKDILLTDYSDGLLDSVASGRLEQHIRSCAACRKLKQRADEMRAAIKEGGVVSPPESVWENIRQKLSEAPAPWWQRAFEKLYIPKPAWAFSYALATVALVALLVFNSRSITPVSSVGSEEARQFAGLVETNGEPIDDFGTSIEEYFL